MGKIIGITGGIASGKSTVTNFLRQEGYKVVDADALVHKLQDSGERLYRILLEHFGQEIILENGSLNRPLLAKRLFSNPSELEWSKETQGKVIREELSLLRDQLAQTEDVFFMDIPLLFEQGYDSWFDEIWLVYVDKKTQIERLMNRDYMNVEEAQARLESQWSLSKKKKLASHIIDNSGTQKELVEQVASLLEGGVSYSTDFLEG